jgi:L-aspartate oxidase
VSAPRWEIDADMAIVGTGVAGLTAALRARELGLRVLVITKDAVTDGSTRYAQGGIAVVLDGEAEPGDTVRRHIDDTVVAGAGLCDEDAVSAIVRDGSVAVQQLRARGAVFDRASDGALARTREGGHTAFRVVHAGGDATGAEVERALVDAATDVPILDEHVAVEAIRTVTGAVGGLLVLDSDGVAGVVRAPAVVLATGGLGQLYNSTTNPAVATGDGVALALRASAVVADLEFVQFHPTVLFTPDAARGQRPLITEAVRGEGAVLLDGSGSRVMAGVHPLGDLAPRDVVSAAIARRMTETGTDHVYLDATRVAEHGFAQRFPTVHAACVARGIDPERDPIPVAPAAHFSCGGVASDVDGRTSVRGLYAVGEVARTGLHGANRLASNSVLEGLVVGRRVAAAVRADLACRSTAELEEPTLPAAAIANRELLQNAMSRNASIGRDALGMATAAAEIERAATVRPLWTRRAVEDATLTLLSQTLLLAAGSREESRGCHVRHDFPVRDDPRFGGSQLIRMDVAGKPIIVGERSRGVAA